MVPAPLVHLAFYRIFAQTTYPKVSTSELFRCYFLNTYCDSERRPKGCSSEHTDYIENVAGPTEQDCSGPILPVIVVYRGRQLSAHYANHLVCSDVRSCSEGVCAMSIPQIWTRDVWARAAAPALPSVEVIDGRWMVSAATEHHADYAGQDTWTVDWLPGRQFNEKLARTAMWIAIAPSWPEVERWAPALGLTPTEARSYVAEVA